MGNCAGARVFPVPEEFAEVFLSDSPGWTRLEPQSLSGDPSPGLEARVHDPAWLLARQWQLGEFRGEDAGSPVSVQVTWTSTPVEGWRPRQPGVEPGPMRPLGSHDLLEPHVESEPPGEPGLRRRFDAGSQFLAVLADAGFANTVGLAAAVLAACRLLVAPSAGEALANGQARDPVYDPAADSHDRAAQVLVDLFGDRLPDAERIAAALEAPTPAAWLPAGATDAAMGWLRWYRGSPGPDCWVQPRLEYAFDLTAGPHLLTAPAFGGGRVDWYHLDHAGTAAGPGAPGTTTRARPVWATPLRFAGMPADRYWEFEDAQVNLGALDAKPHDLARLALAEFALVYSQDWLVVPVDVPVGALTVIDELSYTTTFGERIPVARADDGASYQMFEIGGVPGLPGLPGLLVPPASPGVLDGAAIEEVSYLRDEAANLAWAVERVVRGPSGDPRTRTDEPRRPAPQPGMDPGAELDYLLETGVPDHWVPLVPMRGDGGSIELRKGAMTSSDARPYGLLLRPDPLVLCDEEVPREGIMVRRVPALARRPDGSYARWITRRASVGRGEGASRLAFDSATRRSVIG